MKTGVWAQMWGQIPLTNSKVKKMELIGRIHLTVEKGPWAAVMAMLAMLDFCLTSLSCCWLSFCDRPALCASLYECPASIQGMALYVYGALKNRFIAKKLNGVMFLIWLNLPVKIHQNLMSGFHFYTLHGSKWFWKLLDLHSRLKYHSLRCFLLRCW